MALAPPAPKATQPEHAGIIIALLYSSIAISAYSATILNSLPDHCLESYKEHNWTRYTAHERSSTRLISQRGMRLLLVRAGFSPVTPELCRLRSKVVE